MSQDGVERFLGRLITDEDFREKAGNSLSRICMEHGFDLTTDEKRILGKMNLNEFGLVAYLLNKGIKRSRRAFKMDAPPPHRQKMSQHDNFCPQAGD